jgi:hypothetical protein
VIDIWKRQWSLGGGERRRRRRGRRRRGGGEEAMERHGGREQTVTIKSSHISPHSLKTFFSCSMSFPALLERETNESLVNYRYAFSQVTSQTSQQQQHIYL